jgi:nitrite reductase/ring-hydroxylating ferredoxin subunit
MPVAQRYPVGGALDFPEGKIVARSAGGQDVIIIRRLGQIQCYLDQCTHQPVKLSEFGELSGGRLVCHAHGGTFDLDQKGTVVCDPPYDALKSFVCEEVSGQVAIYI